LSVTTGTNDIVFINLTSLSYLISGRNRLTMITYKTRNGNNVI